jgi:uncharacterized protein with PQ loop repeat
LKLEQIIKYLSYFFIGTALALALAVVLEFSYHHFTIKSLYFSGFSASIFSLMTLLVAYCRTCSQKVLKLLTYFGISICSIGFIIWYGFLNTYVFWHFALGLGVLFLLMIELQFLGWTKKKQGLLIKVPILMALMANLFIAFILFFKVDLATLKPFIFASVAISVLCLFFGLYYYQSRHQKDN